MMLSFQVVRHFGSRVAAVSIVCRRKNNVRPLTFLNAVTGLVTKSDKQKILLFEIVFSFLYFFSTPNRSLKFSEWDMKAKKAKNTSSQQQAHGQANGNTISARSQHKSKKWKSKQKGDLDSKSISFSFIPWKQHGIGYAALVLLIGRPFLSKLWGWHYYCDLIFFLYTAAVFGVFHR